MIIVQTPSREDAYDADGWELADDSTLTLTDADGQPVAVIQPAQWLTVRTDGARDCLLQRELGRALDALREIRRRESRQDASVTAAELADLAGQALYDIVEGDL